MLDLRFWILSAFVFAKAIGEVPSAEMLDLSWGYGSGTVNWPGVRPFEYTKRHAGPGDDGNWYSANEFCTGEHVGTHLDAPYHFSDKGHTVEQIPISKFITSGVTVDVSEEAEAYGPDARLTPDHLTEWEAQNGPIPNNSVLLVRFGWSRYYSNRTRYLGGSVDGDLNFPGISAEAARWIADRGVVGVGVDTASADPGRNHSYEAHRTFADNQIYILENVKIPEQLPAKGYTLIVLPMKLEGGSGGPVRIIALLGSQSQPLLKPSARVSSGPSLPTGYFTTVACVCIIAYIK